MKKSVKIISVIVACLLAIGVFAACGKKEEAKVLTLATSADFPPYEYVEGDKIVGIDAEVAGLIAEKLGMKLEIKDVEFKTIIPGVQQGKYDIGMAGITVDEDRLTKVNFTDSYATGVQVVIVKEDSAIQTIDDLDGKKIGVQEQTTGDIYCSDDYGEDNVIKYDNAAAAIEALKAGKIDCVVVDNEPAKNFVAANTGIKILKTEYAVEDYAIAVAKENTALQEQVNKALAELKADGSLQKVVDKYIPAE